MTQSHAGQSCRRLCTLWPRTAARTAGEAERCEAQSDGAEQQEEAEDAEHARQRQACGQETGCNGWHGSARGLQLNQDPQRARERLESSWVLGPAMRMGSGSRHHVCVLGDGSLIIAGGPLRSCTRCPTWQASPYTSERHPTSAARSTGCREAFADCGCPPGCGAPTETTANMLAHSSPTTAADAAQDTNANPAPAYSPPVTSAWCSTGSHCRLLCEGPVCPVLTPAVSIQTLTHRGAHCTDSHSGRWKMAAAPSL